VQAQVLETITADQITEDVTKDVISQFLPQRKRKQRVNKKQINSVGTAVVAPGGNNNAKVIKTEDESTIQTIIVNSAEEVLTATEIKKEHNGQVITQVIDPINTNVSPTTVTTVRRLENGQKVQLFNDSSDFSDRTEWNSNDRGKSKERTC
jgi:hypothetical protein